MQQQGGTKKGGGKVINSNMQHIMESYYRMEHKEIIPSPLLTMFLPSLADSKFKLQIRLRFLEA